MLAGFKYQKTFRETMIENHPQGYSNLSGVEIQRYRKFTGQEYAICDIYYERFTSFKFYRASYKNKNYVIAQMEVKTISIFL